MAITLEQAQKLNGTTIEFGPRQVRFSLWIKENHKRLYVNNQAGKALACMDLVSGQWIQVKNTGVDAEWRAALESKIADMFQPVVVEVPEVVAVVEAPEAEVTWAECPVVVEVPEVATEENVIVREGYEKVVAVGEVEARLKNHFICKKWSFFLGEERIGGANTEELAEDASYAQLQAYAQSLLDYRANSPKPQPSTKTPAARLAWEIEMHNK